MPCPCCGPLPGCCCLNGVIDPLISTQSQCLEDGGEWLTDWRCNDTCSRFQVNTGSECLDIEVSAEWCGLSCVAVGFQNSTQHYGSANESFDPICNGVIAGKNLELAINFLLPSCGCRILEIICDVGNPLCIRRYVAEWNSCENETGTITLTLDEGISTCVDRCDGWPFCDALPVVTLTVAP